MSITDPTTIDALGIETATGEAVLTISDHLPWDEQGTHLTALENKINAYLGFVESGQIADVSSDASGRPVRILLVYKHEPPAQAAQVLEGLKTELRKSGIAFEARGASDGS